VLRAVDGALHLDAARRPDAASLAAALRLAVQKRVRSRRGGPAVAIPALAPRIIPAALAALVAGWTAWAIPFYPSGWALGLAALAAATTFLRPRVGLAFTLAVPVLPLGNLAAGAAALYVAAALALLVLSWREPESGLFFSLGPLLAPLAALALLPLAALVVRSPVRRGVQTAAAVLTAGIVAGIRGVPLPFDGSAAPRDLGVAAVGDPFDVASALWNALLSTPALAVETLVLAVVAVLLPFARSRGPWAAAALGAAFLTTALLPVPSVAAAPLALAVWATCAAIVVR
jgi:hypothetical protein